METQVTVCSLGIPSIDAKGLTYLEFILVS